MKSTLASVLAPVMLLAGAIWFLFVLGTGDVTALGLVPLGDTRVEAGGFPKAIVDPAGRRMTVPAPPRRIVSLMLGADEVLTAIVEPSRIAAVDHFAANPIVSTCADRIPPDAVHIRGVDPENIIVLQPDMVFVAGYTQESAVRILMGAGIPVVRFQRYVSFSDVENNARAIGSAVGEEQRADVLVAEMWQRLAAVERRVRGRPRPRVLYYAPVGYTEGARSLVDEKIERAGGHNVGRETGLEGPSHVGEDLLITLDPDVIVIPRWSAEQPDVRAELKSPGWGSVKAVKRGRVHPVDVKWLTAVSPDGARGVEVLARLFHPEAFES